VLIVSDLFNAKGPDVGRFGGGGAT